MPLTQPAGPGSCDSDPPTTASAGRGLTSSAQAIATPTAMKRRVERMWQRVGSPPPRAEPGCRSELWFITPVVQSAAGNQERPPLSRSGLLLVAEQAQQRHVRQLRLRHEALRAAAADGVDACRMRVR